MKEERLQTKIQTIIRNYYKELCGRKCENLNEMDKFQKKNNLPKVNEEEAESLNRLITLDEIETIMKNLPAHKTLGPDGSKGEFYRAFKGELTLILHRLFQKNSRRWKTPKLVL